MCAAAAIALGLAACSSTATPTTTTLPSPAASAAAIEHAYAVLFDLASPVVAPKLAVVQNGSTLEAAMTSTLKSPLAKRAAGATVSKVTIERGTACTDHGVPSPCAQVIYDVFGPQHSQLLQNSGGLAVYQHGRWLVAKVTICGLLGLADGKEPPGC